MGILKKLKQKMGLNKEPVIYECPFGESFNKENEQNLKTISSAFDGLDTNDPRYFVAKGLPETMLGHYDDAIEIFTEGWRKYPENLEIQFFLNRTLGDKAVVIHRIDLVKEVIGFWDSFIQLHPNEMFSDSRGTADAYVERGVLKQALGNINEAQEDYKKAREIDPKIPLP